MLSDKRVLIGLLGLNALLLALLIAVETGGDRAWAQAPGGAGGATMTVVTASPSSNQDEPIFIVDSRNEVICVYEFNPGTRKFGLKAARTFKFDKELRAFMNEKPSIEDVESGKIGVSQE